MAEGGGLPASAPIVSHFAVVDDERTASSESEVAIAAQLRSLQERLALFAEARADVNEAYTFEIDQLASHGEPAAAIDAFVRRDGSCNWTIELENSDHAALATALSSWVPPNPGEIRRALEGLLGGSDFAVTRVLISSPSGTWMEPWYEAAWDDFVLSSPRGRFFLHLGLSD